MRSSIWCQKYTTHMRRDIRNQHWVYFMHWSFYIGYLFYFLQDFQIVPCIITSFVHALFLWLEKKKNPLYPGVKKIKKNKIFMIFTNLHQHLVSVELKQIDHEIFLKNKFMHNLQRIAIWGLQPCQTTYKTLHSKRSKMLSQKGKRTWEGCKK